MLHLVEDTARRYGQQPGTVTYADAQGRVGPLIAAYRRLGLEPGSRVALGSTTARNSSTTGWP